MDVRVPLILPCAATAALLALCAGCATKGDHLVFGQSHTVGITVTGPASGSGAEFTLGYKDRNVAIVPVTTTSADGTRMQLKAEGESDVDAFSVLGQFSVDSGQNFTAASGASGAAPGSIQAGLGKFFATGMAARNLADGFAKQMGHVFPQPAAGNDKKSEGQTRKTVFEKDATPRQQVKVAASQGPERAQPQPIDVPLIFGQAHGVGIGIAGSVAEPGEFTLGYRDRDIAIVPLTMVGSDGKKVQLTAKKGASNDSFSVLGQFSVRAGRGSSSTAVVENGDAANPGTRVTLGKFFATGLAARVLALGFKAQIAASRETPSDPGSGDKKKTPVSPPATPPAEGQGGQGTGEGQGQGQGEQRGGNEEEEPGDGAGP